MDGIFPLLCTDHNLKPLQVLKAWKYQPRLEKRFEQFKHVHHAAPLLFKKIERVEANMFAFFVALIVQALLERQIRKALKKQQRQPLKLYPEDRDAPHPTTSQILKTFAGLSAYTVERQEGSVEEYRDELKDVHRSVIELMGMTEEVFWTGKTVSENGAANASTNCGM
jgi:transposase